jgi:hypothetical protein
VLRYFKSVNIDLFKVSVSNWTSIIFCQPCFQALVIQLTFLDVRLSHELQLEILVLPGVGVADAAVVGEGVGGVNSHALSTLASESAMLVTSLERRARDKGQRRWENDQR